MTIKRFVANVIVWVLCSATVVGAIAVCLTLLWMVWTEPMFLVGGAAFGLGIHVFVRIIDWADQNS